MQVLHYLDSRGHDSYQDRVYYVEVKKTTVLLLCGGTKRGQERDIAQAVKFWKDYQQRS